MINRTTKVLSLEDDENLSMVMRHYLEEEGLQFTDVHTGHKCLEVLGAESFDVVLMDLGLPDIDGLTLIPQIRKNHTGPIIVISGKSSTTDRVVGLEMGADDYIVKPFEMRELLARIRANLRKITPPTAAEQNDIPARQAVTYRFLDFEYDTAKMLLTQNGKTVDLTSGECELLELFLTSNGRVLSREYLFEETRGENFDAFDRAVDISVTRLRKKMGDAPSAPRMIKTVRGVGYMFIADVTTSNS